MNKAHIFDPELLAIFLALADAGSFTEAARLVKRSQSNVSTSIRRLEEAAGCTLVNRTTHSVVLTSAGEEMARYARQVHDLSEQAMRRFAQPHVAGCVRLGVFTSFDSLRLGEVLRRFNAEFPTLQVAIETNRSDILLSRFRDGALDIVLATRQPGHGLGEPIWRDELVWVGVREVVRTAREPLPLVARVRPSMLRRVGIEALNVARRRHVVVFEANSMASVAAAVRAGMGASVFTRDIRPLDVPIIEPNALPALGHVDFVLLRSQIDETGAIAALHALMSALAAELMAGAAQAMFGGDPLEQGRPV